MVAQAYAAAYTSEEPAGCSADEDYEEVALAGMVARHAGRKMHWRDFGSHFYLTLLGCNHTSADSGRDMNMAQRH